MSQPIARSSLIAKLALEDGTVFTGTAFGALGITSSGEVVFNTSLSGYQEILTDPSYKGQIVTMTYPQIGNYGIADETDYESARPQVEGFIIKELSPIDSNFRSVENLHQYLERYHIPGIAGIDTRALVRKLRIQGALKGVLCTDQKLVPDDAELVRRANAWAGMAGMDLVKVVVPAKSYEWVTGKGAWALPKDRQEGGIGGDATGGAGADVGGGIGGDAGGGAEGGIGGGIVGDAAGDQGGTQRGSREGIGEGMPGGKWGGNPGGVHVVAVDCGLKRNILRNLAQAGARVTVVPAGATAEEILALSPDGIFVSNGPGDPEPVHYVQSALKKLMGKKPIFGICLGHQLLGLAMGAKTFKLKFGHRGGNQPVRNTGTGKVEITAQNHGFAVEVESLRKCGGEPTHINLNDNTLEGFRHTSEPVFAVQYHPEASPGPHDATYLFDCFMTMIRTGKSPTAGEMNEAQKRRNAVA